MDRAKFSPIICQLMASCIKVMTNPCSVMVTYGQTRLISIVSKPIIIVVVIVVIVFVKKKLGPKKFWLKKIHVQKTLCQNNFG